VAVVAVRRQLLLSREFWAGKVALELVLTKVALL
jgi:hypothetical protein